MNQHPPQEPREIAWWRPRKWIIIMRRLPVYLLRQRENPHAVAAGFAVGVFLCFSPFVGFHFAIAAGVAWVVRVNVVAAVLGTLLGNPLTFGVIWLSSFATGTFALELVVPGSTDGFSLAVFSTDTVYKILEFGSADSDSFGPILIWVTGGVILGLVAAILAYGLVYWFLVRTNARHEKQSSPPEQQSP